MKEREKKKNLEITLGPQLEGDKDLDDLVNQIYQKLRLQKEKDKRSLERETTINPVFIALAYYIAELICNMFSVESQKHLNLNTFYIPVIFCILLPCILWAKVKIIINHMNHGESIQAEQDFFNEQIMEKKAKTLTSEYMAEEIKRKTKENQKKQMSKTLKKEKT